MEPKLVAAPSIVELDAWIESIKISGDQRLSQKGWLGDGGMGVVELVQDSVLNRDLARKTMRPHAQEDNRLVRLFAREACIMAQLAHPSIIPIHDIGTDANGALYFTMKAIKGQTFKAYIGGKKDKFDRDTLLDCIDILTKVCDALSFAHQCGVVHCDIKPDNIMLGAYGEVYIMDWGVARVLGADNSILETDEAAEYDVVLADTTTDHMVMGTPSFMAPEQARGNRLLIDARTDVYALGALLYFALTGRAPHEASNQSERLLLAQTTSPTPPGELVDGIPPFLEELVMSAMSFSLDERPASAETFKQYIQAYVRAGADFPLVYFEAGDVIIREGESGDTAYFIESGRCEVQRMSDGQPKRIRVMDAGEAFGESAILARTTRTATVIALDACALRVVDRSRIEAELDGMRPWMRTFMRTLAVRFGEL
ncbi:MAG: cyclic nucleotide-binding domain-containing protein [Myxococcota bacterium]|nr:cyclic nucleotide-binding domain-containing protein [Myxococcota bacterium]